MAKHRTGTPWMPAPAYSEGLVAGPSGLSVNLLVRDIAAAVAFQQDVLLTKVLYHDPDFAAICGFGGQWCLHADHTYDDHPLVGLMRTTEPSSGRGAGVEIRLHGCDPDDAEARARAAGYTVLAGSADKAHGLREAYLLDADGYCWVPGAALRRSGDESE